MQGLENAIAEDRILRQEAGLESEPGEEWQTESDEESALNKPTGPELFGPPVSSDHVLAHLLTEASGE